MGGNLAIKTNPMYRLYDKLKSQEFGDYEVLAGAIFSSRALFT
jgi:hypothetical protein